MQPKQFRVPSGAVPSVLKKRLLIFIPVMALAVGSGIYIAATNEQGNTRLDMESALIALPIAIAAGVYSIVRSSRHYRQQLASYVITFYDNSIERMQHDLPPVTLYHSEIKRIMPMQGGYCIQAKESANSIMIPAGIERRDELEELLAAVMPITPDEARPFLYRYSAIISLAGAAALLAVYTSGNQILVTLCGPVAVSFLIWAFLQARRSKSVDAKTKKGLLWVWVIIASVVVKMVNVWLQ